MSIEHSVAIDLNKLARTEALTSKDFANIMSLPNNTNLPILKAMMQEIESGRRIQDKPDLIEQMKIVVKSHAKAMTSVDMEDKAAIDKVIERGDGLFDPVKMIASALKAIDSGDDVRARVEEARTSLEANMASKNAKDFARDGILIDTGDKKILVHNASHLKMLFPELTGEQTDYIAKLGYQGMLGGAGSSPFTGKFLEHGLIKEKEGLNITRYVSVANGKVEIISSKDFTLSNISEDGRTVYDPHATVRTSLVADITALKGGSFKLGEATAYIPMHIMGQVIDGQTNLIDEIKAITPASALSEDRGLSATINAARESGGKFQQTARKNAHPDQLASEQHLETRARARAEKIHESAASDIKKYLVNSTAYSSLEQDQTKRNEYAASNVARYLEAQALINKDEKDEAVHIKDVSQIIEPLIGDDSQKWITAHSATTMLFKAENLARQKPDGYKQALESLIYSYVEIDKEKRVSYSSNKVLEYVATANPPSKEAVISIVSPALGPDNTKIQDKDAALILRAATYTKDMSYKDRFMKVVDKVRMSVGLVSENIKTVAVSVKETRKKSWVDIVNAQRAGQSLQLKSGRRGNSLSKEKT